MAIYHQILWLQASSKLTSVPAVVRILVMWTLNSEIELNHFDRKKRVFSLGVFPHQRLNLMIVCAAAGPHSQHRRCHSQRRAQRQVNRILGCTLCSPLQIIIGKERSRRQ